MVFWKGKEDCRKDNRLLKPLPETYPGWVKWQLVYRSSCPGMVVWNNWKCATQHKCLEMVNEYESVRSCQGLQSARAARLGLPAAGRRRLLVSTNTGLKSLKKDADVVEEKHAECSSWNTLPVPSGVYSCLSWVPSESRKGSGAQVCCAQPSWAAGADGWHLCLSLGRGCAGHRGAAAMAVPVILPLFLPGQMKGGGFTCRKGEAVGQSSLSRRTPFYWGWGVGKKLVPRLSSARCEAGDLLGRAGDCDPWGRAQ